MFQGECLCLPAASPLSRPGWWCFHCSSTPYMVWWSVTAFADQYEHWRKAFATCWAELLVRRFLACVELQAGFERHAFFVIVGCHSRLRWGAQDGMVGQFLTLTENMILFQKTCPQLSVRWIIPTRNLAFPGLGEKLINVNPVWKHLQCMWGTESCAWCRKHP